MNTDITIIPTHPQPKADEVCTTSNTSGAASMTSRKSDESLASTISLLENGVCEDHRRAIAAAYQYDTLPENQIAEQAGTSPAKVIYHTENGGSAPRKRGRRRLTEPTPLQQEIIRKSSSTPIRELVK